MRINVREGLKGEKRHITFADIAIGEMFMFEGGFYIRIEPQRISASIAACNYSAAVTGSYVILNAVCIENGMVAHFCDNDYVSRYTGSIDINKADFEDEKESD